MSLTMGALPARRPMSLRRMIVATSMGNALEWYDIGVYGFFALQLAAAFFPAADPTVSLLLSLGTFAISYLARPLGAVVLGAYADRVGRKPSMLLSINLMVVGTALIAFMPSYATIGVAAPVGILLARLLQGFSAGGEFGSSTAYLIEQAPHRRGFIASWQFASQGVSAMLASGFGLALSLLLTPAELQSWGWRIPFVFGLLVGPVGYYIRRHLDEPPTAAERTAASPVGELFARQKGRMLLALGCLIVSTAVSYLLIYMPTYAVRTLGLTPAIAYVGTWCGAVVLALLTPVVGHLSDRIGRTRIMLTAAILLLLSFYPSFLLLNRGPGAATVIGVVVWLSVLKSLYFGALPALMSELFPTATRATGLSLSYNVGVTLFGGFGPFVMTWLTGALGTPLAPSYYLTAVAVLSLLSVLTVRRQFGIR